MIIIIQTQNSTYEIDTTRSLARRVVGANEPTPRFNQDGEWHEYVRISDPTLGEAFVITWPDGQPDLRDNTITSAVESYVVTTDDGDFLMEVQPGMIAESFPTLAEAHKILGEIDR